MTTDTAVVGNHRTTTATAVVYHLLDGVSERRSLNIAVASRTARRTAVCGRFTNRCRPTACRGLVIGPVASAAEARANATASPSLFPLYHANGRGRHGGSAEVF